MYGDCADVKLMIGILFFYTIVNTPPLLQTAPEGKPADEVGIFFIESLLTNVAQVISAVILEPMINE